MRDGPLDMRMDPTRASLPPSVVTNGGGSGYRPVLKTFGEERFAKRVLPRHCWLRNREQVDDPHRCLPHARDPGKRHQNIPRPVPSKVAHLGKQANWRR